MNAHIRKFRVYFIALAFALPLVLFATTGFGSKDENSGWKNEPQRQYIAVERTEGWQAKMQIMSRRR